MAVIEARALTKRFRRLRGYRDLATYAWRAADTVALDAVDLQVERGELFGLLGQNGAGKTTLIRILSTSLLPTAGSASVEGHDVVAEPRAVRRRIAVVQGEERSFYWRLTARQNLEFFAALSDISADVAAERTAALLDRFDLQDEADRPFHALSTGTRQKFGIIRGLMGEPSVLFLDEPTRSLDPIAADAVRRFIREQVVAALGATVILATHSLVEAEQLCDRLAFIRAGRVVAVGSPTDLRGRLARGTRCELHVRGAGVEQLEALRTVPGVADLDARIEKDRAIVVARLLDAPGALDRLLRAVVATDIEVVAMTTHQPTLEEVYIRTLAGPEPDAVTGISSRPTRTVEPTADPPGTVGR